jgi:hypothetical protein
MANTTIIETLGGVAKEESLITLSDNIMLNSFVLETEEPFPGYHGANLPSDSKPISVFLMTKMKYSTEKILRITQNIKKYFLHSFNAVPGSICLNVQTLPCIRIRDLDNYELIGELQKCFYTEGIDFAKKRNIKTSAIIQLRKHFTIQEIDRGIYKDLDDHSMYYLRINHQLKWQLFTQITQRIKNNFDMTNFDSALAAIYTKEILDVVRIYSNDITLDKLKVLKEKYIQEIEKIL